MQLFKLFLLIIPLLLDIVPDNPNWTNNRPIITTSIVGPYLSKEKASIEAQIYNNNNCEKTYKLLFLASNNEFNNRVLFSSQDVKYKAYENINFIVNIDNFYLDKKGITYSFAIKEHQNVLLDLKCTIFEKNQETQISINSLLNKTYKSKILAFQIIKNKIYNFSDEFLFENWNGNLLDETYYKFPLFNLCFKYLSSNYLNMENIKLTFYDSENLFNNMITNPKDNLVEIQLKLNKIDDKYTFIYDQELYVNPRNLDMFLSKNSNNVSTNNLYFPVNGYSKLKDYTFRLSMNNAGISKTNFTYDFKYERIKNLIGDCSNSDFCIIGGADNG